MTSLKLVQFTPSERFRSRELLEQHAKQLLYSAGYRQEVSDSSSLKLYFDSPLFFILRDGCPVNEAWAICTGLRRAEICNLRLKDLWFLLESMKPDDVTARVRVQRKGGKSKWTHVPIPLIRESAWWVQWERPGGDSGEEDDFLFTNTKGAPIGRNYLSRAFREVANSVGSQATFHHLRHAFAMMVLDWLFSAAELRNDILFSEAVYAEFGLQGTEFAVAASLVRRLSREFTDDDYWVRISPAELATLTVQEGASRALLSALTCGAGTYMECLSSFAPMLLVGDRYLSTVTLLSRFVYSWRARVLNRMKRFQIRAGFIFEDLVKASLEEQGFAIQDIVRINRQEFDVVALRDGVIWNVQCKNNFIELSNVDSDAVAFARYNSSLVRSYEKALVKERNREQLLKMKLTVDAVQHMVVSRFPVVTDNSRIVVFNRIAEFAKRAEVVLAASGGESTHV